ncbi:MAG: hypothetical protein JW881_09195 [Spirochaetales bacterium]|nr:hypothetical protein [Spirochaetales bacterium]
MKHPVTFPAIMIVMIGAAPLSPLCSDEYFTYREVSGKGEAEIVWTKLERNDSYIVYERNDGWIKKMILDHDTYETQELSYMTEKKDIKAVKKGDIVYLSGRQNGREIHKEYKLYGLPWIGSVEMSGLSFIKDSSRDSLFFYRILEENLTMYKLVMIKKGKEDITINGKTYHAHRIKIYADGLLSLFYSADAWYSEDGVYLRYKSTATPPGIPATLTELIQHEIIGSE